MAYRDYDPPTTYSFEDSVYLSISQLNQQGKEHADQLKQLNELTAKICDSLGICTQSSQPKDPTPNTRGPTMKRIDAVRNPFSCLNKAKDDEFIFVLLARDPCAVPTVRFWINERIRLGINDRDDPKILEALSWCDQVEMQTTHQPTPVREPQEPTNLTSPTVCACQNPSFGGRARCKLNSVP